MIETSGSLATSYDTQNLVQLDFGSKERRVTLSDPPFFSGWQKIKARLQELSELEKGWDGYNAVPMRFEVGYFAADIIKNLCNDKMHCPQIVPGQNGEVQIEWHYYGKSIELLVVEPYLVEAWRNFSAQADNISETKNLSSDFAVVHSWLSELFESPQEDAIAAHR